MHPLRAARSRRLLVTVFAVLGLLAGGAAAWQLPDRYAATARLLVVTATEGESGDHAAARVGSWAEILGGPEVASRAAEGSDDSGSWASAVESRVVSDTNLIEVTVTASTRDEARERVRAVTEEFVLYHDELAADLDESSAVVIVERPRTALAPDRLLIAMLLAGGLAAGLALGVLIALARPGRERTIGGPQDLAETLDAPLLGAIVDERRGGEQPLITGLDRQHPRVESYRILRTNLQFTGVDDGSRVIVVSSALAGEGKSTTVANLAIVTAQAGQRVAVVEGDLRRPRIAEYLGVTNDVGVTTVLVGRVDLETALQPGHTPGLEVLAAGRRPPNPSELVQTQAMRDLLAELRTRFDVVLIDTPPLLPVTDAAVTAQLADGVVVVVQHGQTRHEELATALGRLTAVDARILGAVLNMAPSKARQAYGAGYFGYGYEYADEYAEQRKGGSRRAR